MGASPYYCCSQDDRFGWSANIRRYILSSGNAAVDGIFARAGRQPPGENRQQKPGISTSVQKRAMSYIQSRNRSKGMYVSDTERMAFLKNHVALFGDFSDDSLAALIDQAREITFEPNEAVIEFGEEGRFLGILLEGSAEVSVVDDSGERHRMATLGAGDIFGEMSLMTGDKTAADVIGLTRCKALLVPADLFAEAIMTKPGAIRILSRLITDRARTGDYGLTGRELEAASMRKQNDPYGLSLKTDTPLVLLVINCGSSSLKYATFDTANPSRSVRGQIERIGSDAMNHTMQYDGRTSARQCGPGNQADAFTEMLAALTGPETRVISSPNQIAAVGHRVVHGGDQFSGAAVIDDAALEKIDSLSWLAPLHNPVNAAGIREARRVFPNAEHIAVFDTAFHHTMPPYAYLYGLPYELYQKHHLRRYGFHGMSHLYVSLCAARFLSRPFNELEIISAHLGNGASLCAIDHGRSIDTSMGMTPTQGLVMGTRCGDVDPAALLHLMRAEGMSAPDVERMINYDSGLKGLSGLSNDMREIERAAQTGDHRALLAFKTFCYQIRKYIGAYTAAMQGLDVVIFTGGIGQGSAAVRSLACQRLDYMGIIIDEARNRAADGFAEITDIAAADSPVRILVIPTDEERMIARETLRTITTARRTTNLHARPAMPVPIEISAHHVHLSQEHVEALFGADHQLTPLQELSMPGQYACKEQVSLIGPKGRVERVRILGPVRGKTQVEIAMTEQFALGVHPPIRESGDLENTPGITLESSAGSVTIDKGVICAMRHIHMPPEDALRFGLKDRDMVRVRIEGDRELLFGDVLVRVRPDFALAMHLDTDEANAANIRQGMTGYIDSVQDA